MLRANARLNVSLASDLHHTDLIYAILGV